MPASRLVTRIHPADNALNRAASRKQFPVSLIAVRQLDATLYKPGIFATASASVFIS